MRIEKPWGYEEILINSNGLVLKRISIKAGHRLSYQYHKKKNEGMYIESGRGFAEIGMDKEIQTLYRDITLDIPAGFRHRITSTKDLVVLEVSSPELDDIVRLEDDYGRY